MLVDEVLLGSALAVTVAAAAMICWLLFRGRASARVHAELTAQRDQLQRELGAAQLASAERVGELTASWQAAEATAHQLREQLQQQLAAQEQLIAQHRVEREQRDAKAREDAQVLEKLAPVDRVINDLKTKVEQMEHARTQQHTELSGKLQNTIELTATLNQTTQSLSRVMSDSSLRGSWGELQLERVAELSGLHKGVNYSLQKTLEGEDQRGRPDMTVYLPGNAAIAIDAKAPFDAYNKAMSAATPDEAKKALLEKHAKDLRGHITALASRDYAKHLAGKVDYVICFVPADSILSAALEADPALLEYAISKRVVLASPTSLVAVLRPVAITWVQVENAAAASEIVKMGQELYSRLSTMASHAAKLGKSIQATTSNYNSFVSSLESRVLAQARRFDKLDASELPEITMIDGSVSLFNTEELRGMNAELDEPQRAIGAPIDAEAIAERKRARALTSARADESPSADGTASVDGIASADEGASTAGPGSQLI